jgi:hypothetical protein
MAKKLPVILREADYLEIQSIARSRGVSVAEWVRQALAEALLREADHSVQKKLAAVRAAVRYEFPASDIETMLAEIGRGR